MDCYELIDLVSKHPLLYQADSRKSFETKDKMWDEIARKLNTDSK